MVSQDKIPSERLPGTFHQNKHPPGSIRPPAQLTWCMSVSGASEVDAPGCVLVPTEDAWAVEALETFEMRLKARFFIEASPLGAELYPHVFIGADNITLSSLMSRWTMGGLRVWRCARTDASCSHQQTMSTVQRL